ncbi:hypothetical protein [Brachybacterium saurashtrense]|uniref:Uncharacterized protein n=1 Tax=Brachybacterium saurashtrense TaxID=556288 RepID=A0A345YM91_9MICO|nr:hypothetical protein [Brachybacterium saurashtrense]AXK45043.1 hypothetical protein DWV08_05055 [Brachybacterium saurashtrense]RRR21727.1 hypothetical protein DXU92_13630 [Brachybacterium saurashtrense]
MPQSQRSRIVSLAVGTAAASGLGMIPVHRLPRPVRAGYVALPAMLTSGVSLLAAQGRPGAADGGDAPRRPRGLRMPTLPEAALSLALGGLMAGAGAAGLRLDGAVEGFLRRRGVQAPRVWIGLATGAVTLASTLLDERAPENAATSRQEQVLTLLTREDPMGLAPGTDGVPEDEYAPEAAAIAELLRPGTEPTAAQLDELWQDWFSQPLSPLLGERRMEFLLEELSALTPERTGV